jgi:hypothetical protein
MKTPRAALYQNLGKLFYAIAMADKKVHPKEIKKLKDAVAHYWVDVDELTDEFGTDAAYQIEIVFDWLLQEEKDSDVYFDAFVAYFIENKDKFPETVKLLIRKTAEDIAASYSGMNKSELMLLGKLKLLLE